MDDIEIKARDKSFSQVVIVYTGQATKQALAIAYQQLMMDN